MKSTRLGLGFWLSVIFMGVVGIAWVVAATEDSVTVSIKSIKRAILLTVIDDRFDIGVFVYRTGSHPLDVETHVYQVTVARRMLSPDDRFYLNQGGSGLGSLRWSGGCPYWVIAAIAAMMPTYGFLRFLNARFGHRYRRQHGLCIKCAYNLKGNVCGVCPECGTAIGRA